VKSDARFLPSAATRSAAGSPRSSMRQDATTWSINGCSETYRAIEFRWCPIVLQNDGPSPFDIAPATRLGKTDSRVILAHFGVRAVRAADPVCHAEIRVLSGARYCLRVGPRDVACISGIGRVTSMISSVRPKTLALNFYFELITTASLAMRLSHCLKNNVT
jgi:hypothetical protein